MTDRLHPTFMGADPELSAGIGAALFGAPHGTPYPNIDNRVHEATAAALRIATAEDSQWRGHWDFDLDGPMLGEQGFRIADLGDLATVPDEGPRNRGAIEARTRSILKAGAVPVMIGGDDSVPIPFLAAFVEAGPITILQIDAHIDWREERYGERFGFSSTMRRASEMRHVERIVQVGMRGLGSARRAEVQDARDWGAKLITSRAVHEDGINRVLAAIPDGSRCVIALDCDALDSSIMPAVAYPSPGGLSFLQVTGLIAGVAAKARVAGFSLVEFVPSRDHSGNAAFTAARIVCNVIGALARAPANIAG